MTSRISLLASIISVDTAKVNEHLEANDLPSPSFDVDGSVDLKLPPETEEARMSVLEAPIELGDLLRGLEELLRP